MIYLDYNATTPVAPQVKKAILPFLENDFGNPSCLYPLGKEAKEAMEKARCQVADLINARPDEIIFTSGGTESNNTVIKGVSWALRKRGRHIITSQIEHPSIVQPCQFLFLEASEFEVSFLPVNSYGMVDPETVKKAIRKDTILISIMHANNEVGTIQLISEIAEIAKEYGITFHTDAAQSIGKIEVDVDNLGIDLLTIAGHKLYAPKGIGALYIRKGTPFSALIHGASQEMGKRAGTENVALAVGLGKACKLLKEKLENGEERYLAKLRDRLWEKLNKELNIIRNGHPKYCIPNTLHLSFIDLEGRRLLDEIPEIYASTGAACHEGKTTLSHVLSAMDVSKEVGLGAVRFSLGYMTTEEEIDRAAELIVDACKKLKIAHSS
ncbi:MAG: cysteine desulfurase [Syntrophobacter sp. DG_60]|nr:MAG: cysteine desulfurase [Syntrophobacter sp. DG_60]